MSSRVGIRVLSFTIWIPVSSSQTSVLLTSGKVTAFDGNFASTEIAKALVKRSGSARTVQRGDKQTGK